MNYVDHFNLFGIDAKQIPCDTGEGAPTTATVGAVGCFYMDTLTGDVYKCVSAANGVYGWELFGAGSPDAVKYTPQGLTDEQKAQARENIGAASDTVNEILFGKLTDKIFDSDVDAFQPGLVLGDGSISTTVATGGSVKFSSPMFEIGETPVKVRINSYNANGIASDYNEHCLYIVQYDSEKNGISGSRKQCTLFPIALDPSAPNYFGTTNMLKIQNNIDNFGQGAELTIIPAEGAKYAILTNFFNGVTIDLEIYTGDYQSQETVGLVQRVTELENSQPDVENDEYDIVRGNENLVATVFGKTPATYKTDFSAIVVADMHGSFISLDDAGRLRDSLVPKAIILNCGDVVNLRAKMNGEINDDVPEYMEKAAQYCVYHTMGQHECGWASASSTEGRLKVNCMTHEEVFNTFIAPMRGVWGLPDLNTVYYYKDFDKTRLISLYQYNVPLVDDETDSTRYKYARNTLWYGQEQLDWLIDALNTVPDGFNVIILQHQLEETIVPDEKSVFYDGTTSGLYGPYMTGDKPVIDIVQAYIDKTTVNKTYSAANTDAYPSDTFTVTVNADFTNARGCFAHYLSGDTHMDIIGVVNNTTQRHIVLSASNQSYDCYVLPNANNNSRSLVSLLGYDYDHGFVRLGRVGQQYAMSGQIRVLEKVSLT